MLSLVPLAERLEASSLGTAIAESRYAFPIIEGTHLFSLAVAVGLIFLIDLRLLGVLLRHVPARTVIAQLRPYALSGFVVVFVSGVLLLWSEATSVIASPAWTFKWVFMVLAGLNALYFECVLAREPEVRSDAAVLPRSVRYSGITSMSLWALVIVCGRLIAYLTSWP
jgi:hypothetical protein